jgi:2-polyprenyl-6-methoxyphenol hydroxylase-like FAD-dependent oxidoreductase
MRAAEDFFFDSSGQVVMDAWSAGRVAVLGDAACCAAPTSGRGTSQALIGAYVLAGEIAECPDHATAFARYEEQLREYVERNQRHGRAAARWFFQSPTDETADSLSDTVDDTVPLKQYACPERPALLAWRTTSAPSSTVSGSGPARMDGTDLSQPARLSGLS